MKKLMAGISLALGLLVGLNCASHAEKSAEDHKSCMDDCLKLQDNDRYACEHACDEAR